MSILVINGCTREKGNTEQLTRHLLNGLQYEEITLREMNISPIEDLRHTENGFPPISGDFKKIVDSMMKSDVLIFTTPVYWYGVSGILKDFFDNWSHVLRDTNYQFKENMSEKTCYAVVVGGDKPRMKALPLIQQFDYSLGFTGNTLQGYIIGKGSAPGDIQEDKVALALAQVYNEELKNRYND